jgi:hypothetical protein
MSRLTSTFQGQLFHHPLASTDSYDPTMRRVPVYPVGLLALPFVHFNNAPRGARIGLPPLRRPQAIVAAAMTPIGGPAGDRRSRHAAGAFIAFLPVMAQPGIRFQPVRDFPAQRRCLRLRFPPPAAWLFGRDTAAPRTMVCRVVALFSFPYFGRIKSSLCMGSCISRRAGPSPASVANRRQAKAASRQACPAVSFSPAD